MSSKCHVPKCPECNAEYSALALYDAEESLAVDVYENADGSLKVHESAGETTRGIFLGYECDKCGYQPLALSEFYAGLDAASVADAVAKAKR